MNNQEIKVILTSVMKLMTQPVAGGLQNHVSLTGTNVYKLQSWPDLFLNFFR
jgi:hypothetical protein